MEPLGQIRSPTAVARFRNALLATKVPADAIVVSVVVMMVMMVMLVVTLFVPQCAPLRRG